MAKQPSLKNQFKVFETVDDLAKAAAADFAQQAKKAILERGCFRVLLSGGNTPNKLFEALCRPEIRSGIPWEKVEVFWGDERCVAHEDPRSNFYVAQRNFLSKVPILKEHIYPIPTHEKDPEQSAKAYEACLKQAFQTGPGEVPCFDLVYLGMGDDGHTASLFPHTHLVEEVVKGKRPDQWVAASWVPKVHMHRVTLLPLVLNHARHVSMLVSGADKAAVLKAVVHGTSDPMSYPCQLIVPEKNPLVWYLDKAASTQVCD